jgi:hypothetical protein
MRVCETCGAPPRFKTGDRVKLNAVWAKHSNEAGEVGKRATVVGHSRKASNCIKVVFDGTKTPQSYHQSFFSWDRRI